MNNDHRLTLFYNVYIDHRPVVSKIKPYYITITFTKKEYKEQINQPIYCEIPFENELPTRYE